jgi:diguanylate cyclase (GGDEF)-like protein
VFAVVAALIPSLATAWLSYVQSRRSVDQRIRESLQSVSSQTARELELWWKERLYELRVFTGSSEVWENLERINQGRDARALARLTDYLASVRERFPDYEALLVLDAQGRTVAMSARQPDAVDLPADWPARIRTEEAVLGDAFRDPALGRMVMRAAVPVRASNGRLLGGLTAKIDLRSVDATVKRLARTVPGELYLIGPDGSAITASEFTLVRPIVTRLDSATVRALAAHQGRPSEYEGLAGRAVVGTLRPVPRLGWGVVAEISAQQAYAQVTRLRNLTILIVLGLLLGVGSLAYLLGSWIVRPLDRLTAGASKVAGGDLDVDLPVKGGGEVGLLTQVFNDMVARLRQKNEELERLSVTDSLTGLYNRRHLMHELVDEIRRSERHGHRFGLLILDIDRFKDYNDRYGHLAGDEVLVRLATILRGAVREVDLAARYGGEEFVTILPETGLAEAAEVAERIRARLADAALPEGHVTVSVGVAEFPTHGDSPESLLAAADASLYEAKRAGRNRVVAAEARTARPGKGSAGAR